MKIIATENSSTLQEWSAFVQVLNQKKTTSAPLLKPFENPEKLIQHLTQEFEKKISYPSIILKWKYGRQLDLAF